jgi:hypothetical protein
VLPSFRLLLAGALAAGIWAVRYDMQAPRPPERVEARKPVETVLPATAVRPPKRPSRDVTGSIARPAVPLRNYRTSARVRLRGQAGTRAPVISVLEAGLPVRELARSGKWRLVSAAGRKGWVHGDYLKAAAPPQLRPKAPVPARTAAAAAARSSPPVRTP